MKGRVFLDTNILIYAASSLGFPEKYSRAEQIMAEEDFGISTQVVGEFVRNVQNPKKMATPLTDGEVDRWIDHLYEFPVLSIDRELIMSATVFQRRYQIGFWDGQILAAAHRFGAALLFSEDLGHGQAYGSLRCENPFRNV
ncbi:MAG TPA: PIN domain-containing protein [Roseiarcus sp.]|jgi:predicted nucleic acid-binding protein|nr:PIN domain-containing protein [Roseiarcus sp.]